MSVRGSGWANKEYFVAEFRRLMDRYRKKLNRPARMFELRRTAWGRSLVTAAFRYYGSYNGVCLELGYGRPFTRTRRVVRPNGPSRRPVYAHWTQRQVQLTVLRDNFTEYIEWGMLPPVSVVKPRFGGLACHWLRSAGGWAGSASALGLNVYVRGVSEKALALAVEEALNFYEVHRRWPTAVESSGQLRHRKFDFGLDWEQFVGSTDFHPRILERLLQRWKDHYAWCGQKHNPGLNRALRTINAIIIELHQREPFGRSSP